jgi:hypothetical protein
MHSCNKIPLQVAVLPGKRGGLDGTVPVATVSVATCMYSMVRVAGCRSLGIYQSVPVAGPNIAVGP